MHTMEVLCDLVRHISPRLSHVPEIEAKIMFLACVRSAQWSNAISFVKECWNVPEFMESFLTSTLVCRLIDVLSEVFMRSSCWMFCSPQRPLDKSLSYILDARCNVIFPIVTTMRDGQKWGKALDLMTTREALERASRHLRVRCIAETVDATTGTVTWQISFGRTVNGRCVYDTSYYPKWNFT